MKHLDEATILTLRDGGTADSAVREHLEACATCRAAMAEAEVRAERIGRTLAALDGPVEATAAKAGVRARLGTRASAAPAHGWGGRHLGRAAALLLVTAGAAAALPWSPVRSLWSPPWSEPAAEAPETPAAVVTRPEAPAEVVANEPGITVAVQDGVVQVVVRGAAVGSHVTVSWSDQPTARLTAPSGSRFTYAAGRVEVDASRGDVGVDLPKDASRVSLEVDGQLYLSGSPSALEVPGPAVERSDDAIRFRVVER
jgi:hypothetical protein